jgi:cold shock protein
MRACPLASTDLGAGTTALVVWAWGAYRFLWRFAGEMAIGVVKWFSPKKGYGFITMDDGQEVFVHYTAIDGSGFRSLEQGEEVQFEVAQGPKGLQAAKVMRK